MKNDDAAPRLTGLGRFITFVLVVGLIALGAYVVLNKGSGKGGSSSGSGATSGQAGGTGAGGSNDDHAAGDEHDHDHAGGADADLSHVPLAEAADTVPTLAPASAYTPADNTVLIELSEYAGYSGLIAANGGLEPSETSYFFQKHGFKVKIELSEEESWSALNSGKMAASATTADVLAVYGRQFQVVVPAQIGFSRGADGLIVRSDIKRVNALKGRAVVAAQFTEAEFFLRWLAQEAGIPVRIVTDLDTPLDPAAINLCFAADAFEAGDLFLQDVRSGGNHLAGCVTWAPKTTEVVEASEGKAEILATNTNLLIVADVLIVNKGFAQQSPAMVAGLVDGLLHGNALVRDNPATQIPVLARAFDWTPDEVREELAKVHLSNLPENLAFFSGEIDMAGSFSGIYQSAVLAYGRQFTAGAPSSERFLDLSHLNAIEKGGAYAQQVIAIAPIRTETRDAVEENPLLSKDIRFLFQPNSSGLELNNAANMQNLESIANLLRVSPGSTVLLRGHVDDAQIAEFRKQGEAFLRSMALKAMKLSEDRAAEIRRLLIERYGVDAARLETVGRGREEPAGTDSEQNRRVEVQWFTIE